MQGFKGEGTLEELWDAEVTVLNVSIAVAQTHLKGRIRGRNEKEYKDPSSVLDSSI